MLKKERLKRIGIDVLGYLLIITAGLTGWIPGPGGIPLLILGLSLLATNHEWAERWLKTAKDKGINISEKLMSDNPRVHWFIDSMSILFLTIGVLILTQITRDIAKTAAIALISSSIILAVINRQRFTNFKRRYFTKK